MDKNAIIEIVDHRVGLWVRLLHYGSQPIQASDQDTVITLEPHQDRKIALIPTIKIQLLSEITLEDITYLAGAILEKLLESSLEDFCDLRVSIDIKVKDQTLVINFDEYNIKRS